MLQFMQVLTGVSLHGWLETPLLCYTNATMLPSKCIIFHSSRTAHTEELRNAGGPHHCTNLNPGVQESTA